LLSLSSSTKKTDCKEISPARNAYLVLLELRFEYLSNLSSVVKKYVALQQPHTASSHSHSNTGVSNTRTATNQLTYQNLPLELVFNPLSTTVAL